MARHLSAAALATVFALGSVAAAHALERKSTLSGPRGSNNFNASGDCNLRACTRNATTTGANGRSATRTGDAQCADGSCTGSRTTTGPASEAVTRTFSLTR